MTTSIWDGLELRRQFPGCTTLREIIACIEADFSGRGEVICEIRVNGHLLTEEEESKFAESPTAEIRDLSVRSNAPAVLITDAIQSALSMIPNLEKSCLQTSEALRGADANAAMKSFHECLDGCQWLVDTLIHIRGAASGIKKPIAQPERWFEAEKMIGRVIREMSEAYSAKDYVLIADLLEYELTSALQVWKDEVELESRYREQLLSGT